MSQNELTASDEIILKLSSYFFHVLCEAAISKGWDYEEDLIEFLDKHFEENQVLSQSMHSGSSDYLYWKDYKQLLLRGREIGNGRKSDG